MWARFKGYGKLPAPAQLLPQLWELQGESIHYLMAGILIEWRME